MTDNLLDEYVKISKTIERIQTMIQGYKEEVEKSIINAKSENEQNECYDNFREMMIKIKMDPCIMTRYKSLKKRQCELKSLILPCCDSEIDLTVNKLKNKYMLENPCAKSSP
jgi:hypothetical protein